MTTISNKAKRRPENLEKLVVLSAPPQVDAEFYQPDWSYQQLTKRRSPETVHRQSPPRLLQSRYIPPMHHDKLMFGHGIEREVSRKPPLFAKHTYPAPEDMSYLSYPRLQPWPPVSNSAEHSICLKTFTREVTNNVPMPVTDSAETENSPYAFSRYSDVTAATSIDSPLLENEQFSSDISTAFGSISLGQPDKQQKLVGMKSSPDEEKSPIPPKAKNSEGPSSGPAITASAPAKHTPIPGKKSQPDLASMKHALYQEQGQEKHGKISALEKDQFRLEAKKRSLAFGPESSPPTGRLHGLQEAEQKNRSISEWTESVQTCHSQQNQTEASISPSIISTAEESDYEPETDPWNEARTIRGFKYSHLAEPVIAKFISSACSN
ncbi:hypothetical protein HYFRA_00009682 [Hymenoscyphus fraxineus]|uniref:Uncharacterized protein n=1 Tax=Hymenoscyphus fraxineus TaxID=746836 RepID=A0A9N9KT08_9HELO|nr:hypothetical protein HYFRA_00009682 [Hymenoscyphus fraxineus]